MNKKLRFLLIWFFVLIFASQVLVEASLSELVKNAQRAVVTVITYNKGRKVLNQGTGFFVDKRGHLITNFHVLKGAYDAGVRTYDGKEYPIKLVVSENEDFDLAEVLVDIPERSVQWVKVTKVLPNVAEPIFVIGSPMGLEQTVSEGIVSAIRAIPNVGKVFQICAPISPGSSGSPVINMKGEVIGVATFQLVEGQNLNFAVPGKRVTDLAQHRIGKPISGWNQGTTEEKLAKKKSQKGHLFVQTDPDNARVRILNIKPKFYQGIELKSGRYHVEVSAEGYETKKMWVALDTGEDKRVTLHLRKIVDKLDATSEYRSKIESCSKVIKRNPQDSKLYMARSSLYVSLGKKHFSNKNYSKAVESYQYAINDSNKAIGILEKSPDSIVLEVSLTVRANNYNLLACSYSTVGQHEEATECFLQAIEDCDRSQKLLVQYGLGPSSLVCYNRGVAYTGLEYFKKAFKAFNKAIQIDPEFKAAYKYRNLAYFFYFNSVGDPDPDAPVIWKSYPTIQAAELEKSGKYNEAIDALNEAIKIDPEDSHAYKARGCILMRMENYQAALRDLDKAIELNPREKDAYFYRGSIYHSVGNYEQAIRDCNKSIQLDPLDSIKAKAYFIRGYSYYLLKEHQQAIMDSNKAIELDPAFAYSYRLRGFAHYGLKNRQLAIRDLRTAAKLGDNIAQDFLESMGIEW